MDFIDGRDDGGYNFRVADHHTYFVSKPECGFSLWAHNVECIIRVENRDHVLLDRATGVEYARGTEAQVRQFALGVHTITDAPRLGPVELVAVTPSGYLELVQMVAESAVFQSRPFTPGGNQWIDGVLYPDRLGIGFAERLADVPQFVRGAGLLTGRQITFVEGLASITLPGDDPLLGDWIRAGYFQPDRLERRFSRELGGTWDVSWALKNSANSENGYLVTITRVTGT